MGKRRRGGTDGDANNHNSSPGVSVPSSHAAMAPGALLQDVDMADVGGVKPRDTTMAMATPVAAEDAIQNGGTPSAVPAGMQIYWNLSSLKMVVRESAAAALVQELTGAQDNFVANGGQRGAAEVWCTVDPVLSHSIPVHVKSLSQILRNTLINTAHLCKSDVSFSL